MDINKIIEEGEKEFDEKFIQYDEFGVVVGGFEEAPYDRIKEHILSQQHKLLQSIVEMIKEETWYRNNEAVTELENNVDYIRVDSLKAKLTINIKE